MSTGALFGFFALMLGGVAAWFGGRFGAVTPVHAVATATARRV